METKFIKAEAEFKRVCNCKTTTPKQFETALRDYYEAKENLYGVQPSIIGLGRNSTTVITSQRDKINTY